MSSRRKKKSSAAHRVYTTRQIMDITEKRRPNADSPEKEEQPASDQLDARPVTNALAASQQVSSEQVPVDPPVPIANRSLLFINLALASFLLVISLKFPASWVAAVSQQLNAMIVHESSLVLGLAHASHQARGVFFSTPYYHISLRGDLVAYGSAELLMFFAVFFALIQNTTWIKKFTVFLTLIPLVVLGGVFRLLWACGLALNYGQGFADQCFHGALVNFVLVFVVLGLIFVELMFSSE